MVMDFSTAQHLAFLYEFNTALLQANKDIDDDDAKIMATSYVRGVKFIILDLLCGLRVFPRLSQLMITQNL